MFDHMPMRVIMMSRHITHEQLGKVLGLSRVSVSNKLRNVTTFSDRDIYKIIVALNLTPEEVMACFFTPSNAEAKRGV